MGKLIALGPGGQAQAPQRRDVCRPVIELVRANGWLDRLLPSPECRTRQQAEELARDLYRSCRYYCSCGARNCSRRHPNYPTARNPDGGCPDGGQRIGCAAEIVKAGDRAWRVEFRLFDKQEAIRQVMATYGPDPNAWPYFARRRQLKE